MARHVPLAPDRGKRYRVERGQPADAAAQGAGAPGGPQYWYLTLGGTAIARLEVQPGEPDAALRARLRQWLAEHPDLPWRLLRAWRVYPR